MIRLLYFTDSLGVGGKERQVVELLKGLQQSGKCEIILACTEYDDFYLADIKKIGIPVFMLYRAYRWDIFGIVRFLFLVNKFKPDIIHTGGLVPTFYAIPVAKILRIPLVNGCIRNTFTSGNYRWRFEKLMLHLSDFRIANSKAGLKSRGFQESNRNIVIYNGFDFQRMENVSKGELVFPLAENHQNKKIVGMVAAFSDYKDYPTFIRAACIILAKRNDTLFVTVGDGKNLEACKRLAQGQSSGIVFMGHQRNVERIVNTFSVGVLATYTEGISNSIMEYMAAYKPVVATMGGATNEIVVDGISGFLVPAKDPYCMAEKIELLLDNPVLANKMGLRGNEWLKQQFPLGKLTDNTLCFYKSILGRQL